jgi:uncharacterized repeat protein (TIGR01451 family)
MFGFVATSRSSIHASRIRVVDGPLTARACLRVFDFLLFDLLGRNGMRRLTRLWGMLLCCAVAPVYAATLTVTTDKDEANCNCSGAGCSPNPACVRTTGSYKLSTGCSLREILQNIVDVNAPNTISYPECAMPTAGGPNTIELGSHSIVVNSTEPLASDSTGVATTNNGSLNVLPASTDGALTIQHGTALSCFTNPSAMPAITLNTMFDIAVGGDVTFDTVHFQNCTTQSGTAAGIWAKGSANLTLINGTTFTNMRSTGEGTGGCINHGNGNLTITGGAFSGCVVDNGSVIPGGGNGQGGALYIGNVGNNSLVTISGVAFSGNIAGQSGGAIYLSGTDAITISGGAFTGNFATGNTFASGNAEFGGGAIYATNTANGGNLGGPGVNASEFLIFQSSFIGNQATQGTGGAILLTGGGSLTYGSATINVGQYQLGNINGIPGGIVASNFSGNVAMGSWDTVNNGAVDPRAGSGGAIYASGKLSILASSFVGSNASTNASGGAIALYDASDSFAPMTISNTTFNSNSAAVNGGAIANLTSKFTPNSGKITLINDTISGNSAAAGGSFHNGNATPAEVNVSNTIFDGGTGGNCAGNAFTNVAGNLQFNPASGCASIANTGDPKLQSPSVFGGVNALVFVMKLNSGSAASGTGNPAVCTATPIFDLDEALNSRPQGKPNCDVGAFESGIVPDLTIAKSHTDPFTQGDVGDTYTITVSNSGNDSTTGTVTVTDTLPPGAVLTASAINGTNWNCVLGTLTCTRADALASSASYEPITLTVNVAANATPGIVTNTATVAGGSEANTGNDSIGDQTTIVGIPDLTITKQHVDPFAHGQIGDTYTIKVSNIGTGPTSGTVTVTDALPSGLTATSIAGTGWTGCTVGSVVGPGMLSCSRSDALANGAFYPDITLTVNVAVNAPSPVTNTVSVAGGNEVNTANDTATDPTTTPVRLQTFSVD